MTHYFSIRSFSRITIICAVDVVAALLVGVKLLGALQDSHQPGIVQVTTERGTNGHCGARDISKGKVGSAGVQQAAYSRLEHGQGNNTIPWTVQASRNLLRSQLSSYTAFCAANMTDSSLKLPPAIQEHSAWLATVAPQAGRVAPSEKGSCAGCTSCAGPRTAEGECPAPGFGVGTNGRADAGGMKKDPVAVIDMYNDREPGSVVPEHYAALVEMFAE